MTETSCLITGTQPGDYLYGHVGSPSPSCGKFHISGFVSILVGCSKVPIL